MCARCLCLFAIMFTSLTGCHLGRSAVKALPPGEAPKFALEPLPRIRLASSQPVATVAVVDARPAAERVYYPGLNEPRHWRDAVTMLPAESFDPSIVDQLTSKLEAQLPPDVSVHVELTSCFVVFDERLLQSADQSMRREGLENERAAADDRTDAADDGSFSQTLFLVLREATRSTENLFNYSDLPQQTPGFVTADCREGLNVHLDAVVTVTDSSSRQDKFPVSIRENRDRDLSKHIQPQVAVFVDESLDRACAEVVQHVQGMKSP